MEEKEYKRLFMSSYKKNLFNKIEEAINRTALHQTSLIVTPNFKIEISPNDPPKPTDEITYIRIKGDEIRRDI